MIHRRLEIRQFGLKDVEPLAYIYSAIYSPLEGDWPLGRVIQSFSDFYAKQPELALVAEQNGLIVGGTFAGIKYWNNRTELESWDLFVDPLMHGRKIGPLLLRELINKARREFAVDTYKGLRDHLSDQWVDRLGLMPTGSIEVRANIADVLNVLSII